MGGLARLGDELGLDTLEALGQGAVTEQRHSVVVHAQDRDAVSMLLQSCERRDRYAFVLDRRGGGCGRQLIDRERAEEAEGYV